MPPAVSVIIPAYNHGQYIAQTIESVLGQTLGDLEILVINDGSPDDTASAVKPYVDSGTIRYFEQPNAGVSATRNRGIKEARGEFVALLDDDDIWPADKLEWQLDTLRADPKLAGVAGELWHDPLPLPLKTHATGAGEVVALESLFFSCPFSSPGQCLFRRDAILAVGGFDPSIWGADDFDLYLKLTIAGRPILRVPRTALYYRVHQSNASHQSLRMFENSAKCVDKRLADVRDDPRWRVYRKNAYRMAYNYRGSRIVREGGPLRPVLGWAWPIFLQDPRMAAKLFRDLAVRSAPRR